MVREHGRGHGLAEFDAADEPVAATMAAGSAGAVANRELPQQHGKARLEHFGIGQARVRHVGLHAGRAVEVAPCAGAAGDRLVVL